MPKMELRKYIGAGGNRDKLIITARDYSFKHWIPVAVSGRQMDATTQRILDISPAIESDDTIEGRLQAFNALLGGGASKNRRRKALAVEIYRGFQRHLHTLESPEAAQLLNIVGDRIAEVISSDFSFFAERIALQGTA